MASTNIRQVTLSGLTPDWDANQFFFGRINGAAGDIDITVTLRNKAGAFLVFIQDATGDRTLTINGTSVTVDPAANATTIVQLAAAFSTIYPFSNYNAGNGNETPVAPGNVSDDDANTQAFTHALGTGELEVSINNGSYAAYAGPYSVGNVVRAAGYYKCRVKAATGRNVSAVTNSSAFTEAAEVVYFEAEFIGAASTALSAYTPETGSINTITGSPTLNGSGGLVMPASSQWYTQSLVADVEATIIVPSIATGQVFYFAIRQVDANNFIYVYILQDSGTHLTFSLNEYAAGVNTELYNSGSQLISSTGLTLVVSANGSTVTATMGSFTSGADTTTVLAAGSARLATGGGQVTISSLKIIPS